MTMFPQEPYSQVGGCTHTLTQTTQVQARYPLPVARVRGYYYVPSSALSHGSLSRVLPLRGQFVDTLVLQVIAYGRAPTHEAKILDVAHPLAAFVEGAGQRACTVPTSASTLYRQYSTNVQQVQDFLPAGRHLERMPVTLSAAKGLTRRTKRSFAALRMTARTPLKSAHGKPSLQMSSLRAAALSSRPVNGDGTSRAVLLKHNIKLDQQQKRGTFMIDPTLSTSESPVIEQTPMLEETTEQTPTLDEPALEEEIEEELIIEDFTIDGICGVY